MPTYKSGKRNTDYSETAGFPVETFECGAGWSTDCEFVRCYRTS